MPKLKAALHLLPDALYVCLRNVMDKSDGLHDGKHK
jgi:hypothetical protein